MSNDPKPPIRFPTNVQMAGNRLGQMFAQFADSFDKKQREDFFHGINRKNWMKEFGIFLQQKAEEIHES